MTSISIDHHKYGLSPKGLSCIMFNSMELRQMVYFQDPNSIDLGFYTTALSENVNACALAGGWYTMMTTGQAKYAKIAQNLMMTT